MDENKTNEEGKKEEPVKTEDAGDKYETTPVIERARQEREKLELANKKTEELLDRQEQIMAKRELGGMSEAGTTQETQYSDEEKASRKRIKAVAEASGSSWGKKYE